MRNKLVFLLALSCLILILASCQKHSQMIDLSGQWQVVLEDENFKGQIFNIELPGTTDAAEIGYADTLSDLLQKPQLLRLTRNYRYVGKAIYTRQFEVPAELAGRPMELTLDRVLWTSKISIDGQEVDKEAYSLVTPHRHRLPALTKGKHSIEMIIDNSMKYDISVDELCHSYTDATQVMWNGVLGKMELRPLANTRVARAEVYPDIESQKAEIVVYVESDENTESSWNVKVSNENEGFVRECSLTAHNGENRLTVDMTGATLWNEFSPILYNVCIESVSGEDLGRYETTFGMRQIASKDGKICINNNPVFLRGTLECCIFPMSGTPPTDEAGWEKVLGTAHEWGLNHLRFHSWCPPDAAFRVADRMGFYLSVELPVWSLKVGDDPEMMHFMEDEMENIIGQYGNHPSLCMISNGNELQHDFDFLNGLTAKAKARDNRHLYITTSFTFEPGHGGKNEPEDDYYVTQWTDNGWVRGQGVFDAEVPSFDKNYNSAMGCLSVPLVSHEIGQYSVYPDLKEIDKYTGTLTPHNFKAIRNDLERKGLLDKADDYLNASGQLAAILYKEECERAMKTQGLSGYQLLGLQDFPGQGTALIGLVNAFWESKHIVEADWFRMFCAPIVPLANFAKATWSTSEDFEAVVQVANYSVGHLTNNKINWKLTDAAGEIVADGSIDAKDIPNGDVNEVGSISVSLCGIDKAQRLTLALEIADTDWHNMWNIWVYPEVTMPEDVYVTDDVEVALARLDAGEKVLLSPKLGALEGLEGKYLPVFWSPVHFPKQAGTMGVLCDPNHPALAEFPTDSWGDWQWWRLAKRSTVLLMDKIARVTPIVEQVDNFVNNRRLAIMFEAKCGNGRLVFSAIDLLSEGADSPELRQMLYSIEKYIQSESFAPETEISPAEIRSLFKDNAEVVTSAATSIYN